ncbi:protein NRT1/ PTR FAMILY 5.7-like [Aristolochia californica]|uniref:protein NRT1/ PTR FAMILY 5.7-like n=1 Tax=Aristolochia californica TaxID=171875 RepID=UPI0035D83EC8
MATQVLDNPKIGGRLRTYVCELREETNKFINAWRASFFILGVVSSNSFAEYTIVWNLIDFIMSNQRKKLAPAAATIYLSNGLSSFLDILGAFVLDARLGRHRGIGIFVLLLSLELPELAETIVFYIALLLIAAGRCGQGHTLREFGLDQFKSRRCVDKTKARIHNRVWWYLGKLVGVVTGITTNSILTKKAIDDEDENQYWKSVGTYSLLTMAVTFLLFLSGTLLYTHVKPGGSPLTRILRVFVAALRNRRLRCPDHANELYEERNLQDGVFVCDPQGNANEPINASQLIEDQQLLQENLPDDNPELK